MKLSVFAIDLPVPPNSGARIDIYRRLQALTRDGFKIQLFAWVHSTSPEDLPKIEGVCDEIIYLKYREGFSASSSISRVNKLRVAALKLFSFTPSICEAMALSAVDLKRVIGCLEAFNPDVMMIDGLQCAHAGLQAHKKWRRQIPVLYRSHNREFKYNYDLGRNLRGWGKKALYYCDAFRLLYYEPLLFHRVSATLQISYQDFVFWSRLRLGRQFWLPPIAEQLHAEEPEVKMIYDVVILSGWTQSQKVAGLVWFLEEVKPLLPDHLKIVVAGRGASSELQERCRRSGCIFLGHVADAHEMLAQGGVLINAVFGGSGFYIKMLDMVRAGRPIVSTPDGAIGMDSLPGGLIRIAATPQLFAEAILDALKSSVDHRAAVAEFVAKYSGEECARRLRQILAGFSDLQ